MQPADDIVTSLRTIIDNASCSPSTEIVLKNAIDELERLRATGDMLYGYIVATKGSQEVSRAWRWLRDAAR